MGGFGSAVIETLADLQIAVPVVRIGWPDKFIEHASNNATLQDKYGLNAATAVAKVNEALAEAQRQTVAPGFRIVNGNAGAA
jgi:1-deoxy-D-xylulose-5-phosphate synthase